MKLADLRSAYQELSGKASDIARTMSLSGIAVIWVFREGEPPKIPRDFIPPGILILLSLFADLCQYLWATSVFGISHWLREGQGVREKADFLLPTWYNTPTLVLFIIKMTFLICAYVGLLAGVGFRLL